MFLFNIFAGDPPYNTYVAQIAADQRYDMTFIHDYNSPTYYRIPPQRPLPRVLVKSVPYKDDKLDLSQPFPAYLLPYKYTPGAFWYFYSTTSL